MTTLTFDLGSRMGWAFDDGGRGVVSGVQEFALARGESAGMRLIRFRAWLREMLDKTSPEIVLYEQAHHRGGFATDLLVGFVTLLKVECESRKIEYQGVHSATLKKAVTGSGRADKGAMIERAAEAFGRDVRTLDDNESDALGLILYARQTVSRGEAA